MVLRLRTLKNRQKTSKSNDVTLLPMESGFFCAVQKVARQTCARRRLGGSFKAAERSI
jgi:hypothetical protein